MKNNMDKENDFIVTGTLVGSLIYLVLIVCCIVYLRAMF